jgi:hypothetical protein
MRRGLLRVLLGAGALAAAVGPASATLWDDDTLRAEATGLPNVLEVITGRFERNPPLYYEVRLAHAEKVIATDPDAFNAYDNACVACDRLGRGADAIRWMEKKRVQLLGHPDIPDQEYRTHANLGTVLAWDWIRRGADHADTSQLKRARDEIAAAVRMNRDVHFGRERVQLATIEWMLEPPPWDGKTVPSLLQRGTSVDGGPDMPADDVARGLAGLVVLGHRWENPDTFAALGSTLAEAGNFSVAELAWLRVMELARTGKRSLYPGAPHGEPLVTALVGRRITAIRDARSIALASWFERARAAADQWTAEREAYMTPLLQAGRHPDWDPLFWDDFSPSGAAEEPSQSGIEWDTFWGGLLRGERREVLGTVIVAVLLALFVALGVLLRRRLRRDRLRARRL